MSNELLSNFYRSFNEHDRLASRQGSVEFLTTVHYIEKYLRPGMRIAEIGAGSGRYAHYFAQQGYCVDAIELLEHNIEECKRHTIPGESITVVQGNALCLDMLADNVYDITLLLGPMYHLYTETEKIQALSETMRITKPGGIIYAAYTANELTIYRYYFEKGNMKQALANGAVDPITFHAASVPEEIFELYRKEDIDALMEKFDAERLHYVGTDMLTKMIAEAVNAMDDDTFALYMRYHLSICERADMTGATNHILDVFRKKPCKA